MPTKITCYLILLLRYAGSMSYFTCDGAGYHITCVPWFSVFWQIQKTNTRNTHNLISSSITCEIRHTSTIISDNK